MPKGLQAELGVEEEGLKTELGELRGPVKEPRLGGGSDDIGDISWTVPTVTMRFPSNVPGGPGHHWANAVAMATPIAHKGATAGAKVMAMTALELFMNPELVDQAWKYFKDEQTKDHQYTPFIAANDPPAIHLNKEKMDAFRETNAPFLLRRIQIRHIPRTTRNNLPNYPQIIEININRFYEFSVSRQSWIWVQNRSVNSSCSCSGKRVATLARIISFARKVPK